MDYNKVKIAAYSTNDEKYDIESIFSVYANNKKLIEINKSKNQDMFSFDVEINLNNLNVTIYNLNMISKPDQIYEKVDCMIYVINTENKESLNSFEKSLDNITITDNKIYIIGLYENFMHNKSFFGVKEIKSYLDERMLGYKYEEILFSNEKDLFKSIDEIITDVFENQVKKRIEENHDEGTSKSTCFIL